MGEGDGADRRRDGLGDIHPAAGPFLWAEVPSLALRGAWYEQRSVGVVVGEDSRGSAKKEKVDGAGWAGMGTKGIQRGAKEENK